MWAKWLIHIKAHFPHIRFSHNFTKYEQISIKFFYFPISFGLMYTSPHVTHCCTCRRKVLFFVLFVLSNAYVWELNMREWNNNFQFHSHAQQLFSCVDAFPVHPHLYRSTVGFLETQQIYWIYVATYFTHSFHVPYFSVTAKYFSTISLDYSIYFKHWKTFCYRNTTYAHASIYLFIKMKNKHGRDKCSVEYFSEFVTINLMPFLHWHNSDKMKTKAYQIIFNIFSVAYFLFV